jgi:hypothetical protein
LVQVPLVWRPVTASHATGRRGSPQKYNNSTPHPTFSSTCLYYCFPGHGRDLICFRSPTTTMPDKSIGWRKKIHSKPKDIRSRHTPISRPSTPVPTSTSSNAVDADDARSETSRPSTPGRPPTLARLVSSYRTLIDTPKESAGDFAEPWSDVAPPLDMLPIDPLLSMQSIYAHMNASSTRPIPVGHNSALFRIFEDYRKARASKNGLEKLLQQALEGMRIAEEAWVETEAQYQAEIRRLELLMVRGGVSSIAG